MEPYDMDRSDICLQRHVSEKSEDATKSFSQKDYEYMYICKYLCMLLVYVSIYATFRVGACLSCRICPVEHVAFEP